MKLAASLLALLPLVLTACHTNTLATRRSLYAPERESGPYNRALADPNWRYRGIEETGPRAQLHSRAALAEGTKKTETTVAVLPTMGTVPVEE